MKGQLPCAHGLIWSVCGLSLALAAPLVYAEPAPDLDLPNKHETVGEVPLPPSEGPFESHNVHLHARIRPDDLPHTPSHLTDVWGHVSSSGREYALVGSRSGTAFIEVTDSHHPVIVDVVPHGNACCSDIKTYMGYAYVVAENLSTGLQVIDLHDIDDGVVTHVDSHFGGGINATHNFAINEETGFAYACGSVNSASFGGIAAYDLVNPEAPVFKGYWPHQYVHDLQVVTYHTGPYAGKSIAFASAGLLSPGLWIIDVTNPANMFVQKFISYPNASFAHQGWLSDDRRFFYLNDEFDELNEGVPTSTYVFDVQDLNNPKHIATFGSGLGSTDHNLMVKGQFVYEANYSSGLRIFHARTPYNVTEVGWIDTYPAHDNVGFIGAWGIYPMLPSGTILVSDITNGLFILDAHAAHASVPPLPALNLPAAVLLTLLGLVGGMFTCRRIFATIR